MAKDSQKLSKKTAEEPKDLSNPDEILEEDELDEDPEEGEPPVSEVSEASDTTLDEDKIEAGIDEEEDLLEGIPEEELKATTDVQLPKVTTARSKRRATRKRANDGGVTMLTGDPVRMYLKDIGKVLWKEVRVALILGVILALVNFLRIWFFTPYDRTVAFIVSLAMFFTIIIAKSIGCTLPLLAKAIHLDPALMASPIITTLVDAASLTVLFTFASTIMKV